MRAPVKTILSVLLTAGGLLSAQEPLHLHARTRRSSCSTWWRATGKARPSPTCGATRSRSSRTGRAARSSRSGSCGRRERTSPQHRRPPVSGDGRARHAEAATPSRANLVVLVFDVLPVATAPLARQGALDLLSKEFPANTWFAVFKVDRGGMRQLQAFTSDPARLASAVDFATTGDDARRGGTRDVAADGRERPATTTTPAAGPTRPDAPPNPVLAGIGAAGRSGAPGAREPDAGLRLALRPARPRPEPRARPGTEVDRLLRRGPRGARRRDRPPTTRRSARPTART